MGVEYCSIDTEQHDRETEIEGFCFVFLIPEGEVTTLWAGSSGRRVLAR